jgi:predicted nucleic acid-binding protein
LKPAMDKKLVVIDACCMLNLLATGREVDIVRSLSLLLLETPQVSREPVSLSTAPDEDGVRRKEPTSTAALRAVGFLETRALSTEALLDAFVACAARIKDTDASCIALAGVLKIPLITDDRKERKVATDIFPSIELVSTLDLVHDAASSLQWNADELVEVASNLRWRGNFAPPKRDPRGEWYLALLERAGIAAP